MLKGKDIINTSQFSLGELDLIMNTAADFEKQVKDGNIIRNMDLIKNLILKNKLRSK